MGTMPNTSYALNKNNAPIVVGAKYRLSPKKTSPSIFILQKISGDGKRVLISNINTQAVRFWRKVNDLYWCDSKSNQELLKEIE